MMKHYIESLNSSRAPPLDTSHLPCVRRRKGRCFETCALLVKRNPSWEMVNCTIIRLGYPGVRFKHCVIQQGRVIYDATMGLFFTVDRYTTQLKMIRDDPAPCTVTPNDADCMMCVHHRGCEIVKGAS
jgi:hypothetical protein